MVVVVVCVVDGGVDGDSDGVHGKVMVVLMVIVMVTVVVVTLSFFNPLSSTSFISFFPPFPPPSFSTPKKTPSNLFSFPNLHPTIEELDDVCEVHDVVNNDVPVVLHRGHRQEESQVLRAHVSDEVVWRSVA